MKVFRFTDVDIIYGEHIVLIAASDVESAEAYVKEHTYHRGHAYEHEVVDGLTYDGECTTVIENFYWEE